MCFYCCTTGLFQVFDVNCDSHIDLSEMVNIVSLCCRRPEEEKHKGENVT